MFGIPVEKSRNRLDKRLLIDVPYGTEYVIVSGDKSTLAMRPVFGEYYNGHTFTIELHGLMHLHIICEKSRICFFFA